MISLQKKMKNNSMIKLKEFRSRNKKILEKDYKMLNKNYLNTVNQNLRGDYQWEKILKHFSNMKLLLKTKIHHYIDMTTISY
jgi:hypothetical protein